MAVGGKVELKKTHLIAYSFGNMWHLSELLDPAVINMEIVGIIWKFKMPPTLSKRAFFLHKN